MVYKMYLKHCVLSGLLLLLFSCTFGECDHFLNKFIDRYINGLWSDSNRTGQCVHYFPNREYKDVGKDPVEVTTSDAVTGFLCWTKRNGDAVLRQTSSDTLSLSLPLKADRIVFNFRRIRITSSGSDVDLEEVNFTTQAEILLQLSISISDDDSPDCETSVDIDVQKLNDFTCYVKGRKNEIIENWINKSEIKKKFSPYLEKQYAKFVKKLNICDGLFRSALDNDCDNIGNKLHSTNCNRFSEEYNKCN